MKKRLSLLTSVVLLLSVCSPIFADGQENESYDKDFNRKLLATEDENTVDLLGGLGLSATGKNGFTDEHSGTSIFFGIANYNHYVSDNWAFGLDYTYLGSHSGKDLLRCHFVGPDILGRVLMKGGKQAMTFSLAPGYMHYADKTEKATGHFAVFNKSYFAAKFSMGYHVAFSNRLAFVLRTDLLTSSWSENENYYIGHSGGEYYIDKYGHVQKDETNNELFKASLLFFSLTAGLSYRF